MSGFRDTETDCRCKEVIPLKKFMTYIKRQWILVWIFLAAIGIASTVTFARYIEENNRAKRVAANVAGAGQPFDSNYLTDDAPLINNIPFPSDTVGVCPVEIKIWNYNRANAQKTYKGLFTYDLIAQLVDSRGEQLVSGTLGAYQIGISSDGGSSFSYFTSYDETNGYYMLVQDDRAFTANASGKYEPTEHAYILRFPSVFLTDEPGIYVKLTATPSDTEKLSPISAIIGVKKQEATLSRVWEGRFNEDTSQTSYDSFNYVISGSGEANITFSWRSDYLQMNSYNLTDHGFSATSTTRTENSETAHWNTITFRANSNDSYNNLGDVTTEGKSRYDFQLYMTTQLKELLDTVMNQNGATYEDYWNQVNEFVEFSSAPVTGE